MTEPIETPNRVATHVATLAEPGRRNPALGGSEPPSAAALALRERAHRAIPGGCHTAAKGDDQYPVNAPPFIARGSGCHIWDTDGREYIEYAMGLRAVTLGHATPSVVEAAHRAMLLGNNFNRPAPLEVECAEMFLELVPNAEMVKFTKDGSSVMTAALKLARAHTGRDMVALCADSPFFSYDDWFIGTTAIDSGVPAAIKALTTRFRYNDIASVQAMFDEHPERIACVMLEPARTDEPADGFLHEVQALCRKYGAVFVLDETITGFRWHKHGAQHVYGITPDLCCFGKAMANGFALAALAGKREIMELGGIRHTHAQRVFLLSTTHGAESPALAAAMETMRIYRDEPVTEHLYAAGDRLRAGVEPFVADLGLERHFKLTGRGCAMMFGTLGPDLKPSQAFRTLFLQEILKRGVLAPSFLTTYSHSDADVDHTVWAVCEALKVYADALEGGVERFLVGPPSSVVYRKFN